MPKTKSVVDKLLDLEDSIAAEVLDPGTTERARPALQLIRDRHRRAEGRRCLPRPSRRGPGARPRDQRQPEEPARRGRGQERRAPETAGPLSAHEARERPGV